MWVEDVLVVQRVREECSRPVCGTDGAFYGFFINQSTQHSLGMITQLETKTRFVFTPRSLMVGYMSGLNYGLISIRLRWGRRRCLLTADGRCEDEKPLNSVKCKKIGRGKK